MLLAEDGLDTVLERLAALPRADRRAILRLLNEHERRAVERLLAGPRPTIPLAQDDSPRFSPALAGRLAEARHGAEGTMTAATRAALLEGVASLSRGNTDRPARGPSLFAAARARLGRRA